MTLVVTSSAGAGPNCPAGYHCAMKDNILDIEYHCYFSSNSNFTNDYFANGGGVVNDVVSLPATPRPGLREPHYCHNINYGGGLVFCVRPGSHAATLSTDRIVGNGFGRSDEASSLRVGATSFLKAAAQLRVPPEHCFVYEDTEPGVTAALAAGGPTTVDGGYGKNARNELSFWLGQDICDQIELDAYGIPVA